MLKKPSNKDSFNKVQFLKWLSEAQGCDFLAIESDYSDLIEGFCEFFCIYFSMMYFISPYAEDLRVVDGYFIKEGRKCGHFWIEYNDNGKIYIIDATIQQFVPDAPIFYVCEKSDAYDGYLEDKHVDYSKTIKEFCHESNVFKTFKHPIMF